MTSTTNGTTTEYDVAILGTGLIGSMLATILARNGVQVLMIDAKAHPRFAIGESTIPAASRMFEIMADRYDVPELKNLAGHDVLTKNITTSCGVKKHFGFVYHERGAMPDPKQSHMLKIPGELLGFDCHLFRQDTDSFMFHTALQYGATAKQNCWIKDVDFDDDGVTLHSSDGEAFRAKCLVDGCGYASPLTRQLGLREEDSKFRTHSRTLFTHMIGVEPFETSAPAGFRSSPVPWSQGTLHHVFDGGWLWVIPFDNVGSSNNPLCSVGLQVDERRFPKPEGMSAEEDFYNLLSDLPGIKPQFRKAKSVRPWVHSDRLQYSCTSTVQDRYLMLSHTAGFVDPLYSRGLANSSDLINSMAWRLIRAKKDGDYSAERFEYIDRLNKAAANEADLLVWSSYISFRDFDLWNAWVRLWALGQGYGELDIILAHLRYQGSKNENELRAFEEPPGAHFAPFSAFKNLFAEALDVAGKVENGELDSKAAATKMMNLITNVSFGPPLTCVNDPAEKYWDPGLRSIASPKNPLWLMRVRDKELKTFHKDAIKLVVRHLSKGIRHQ